MVCIYISWYHIINGLSKCFNFHFRSDFRLFPKNCRRLEAHRCFHSVQLLRPYPRLYFKIHKKLSKLSLWLWNYFLCQNCVIQSSLIINPPTQLMTTFLGNRHYITLEPSFTRRSQRVTYLKLRYRSITDPCPWIADFYGVNNGYCILSKVFFLDWCS